MVLQESWLKSGTIFEYLKMGVPDATEEEVVEAPVEEEVAEEAPVVEEEVTEAAQTFDFGVIAAVAAAIAAAGFAISKKSR